MKGGLLFPNTLNLFEYRFHGLEMSETGKIMKTHKVHRKGSRIMHIHRNTK